MPLKTYDSNEAVPEAQRASAIETKDGKWLVEEPQLGDSGKDALEKERLAKKAAEDRAKKAEQERDELKRTAEAKAKGISEEELQKIRQTEADARKPIEEERDRLAAENRKLKLTDRVRAHALKSGVMAERIDDAMTLLEGRTDLGDADGIVVKGKDGKVTTETVEDFLGKTFKAEKPYLYAAAGGSGGGSSGSEGGGGESGRYDPVAEGKALAEQQKALAKENELAFK